MTALGRYGRIIGPGTAPTPEPEPHDPTRRATTAVEARPVVAGYLQRAAGLRLRVGLRSGRVATLVFVNQSGSRARVMIGNYATRIPVDQIEYLLIPTEELERYARRI